MLILLSLFVTVTVIRVGCPRSQNIFLVLCVNGLACSQFSKIFTQACDIPIADPGLQEGRQQEAGVALHQVQPEGPQVRGPGQPQNLPEAPAVGRGSLDLQGLLNRPTSQPTAFTYLPRHIPRRREMEPLLFRDCDSDMP